MLKPAVFFVLFAAFPTAYAEYRQIDVDVRDLDCASCVTSLTGSLKKIRGVEKAEIGTSEGIVKITLAAENKVTLERVRDQIKGAGFTPGAAKVVVRGKAITDAGKWQFTIEGPNQTYLLTTTNDDVVTKLKAGGVFTVAGICPAMANPRDQPVLEVQSIRE